MRESKEPGLINDERVYPSITAKRYALIMLVSVPVGVTAGILIFLFQRTGISQDIQRQFINCFVSIPPFLALIALTVLLFVVSKEFGVNPFIAVATHRLRFFVYSVLVAILGVFILRTPFLSHHWFYWSLSQRIATSLTNFTIVVCFGSAYLLVLPVWSSQTNFQQKLILLSALVLWGYILASGFRMLPFPYVTGVE